MLGGFYVKTMTDMIKIEAKIRLVWGFIFLFLTFNNDLWFFVDVRFFKESNITIKLNWYIFTASINFLIIFCTGLHHRLHFRVHP